MQAAMFNWDKELLVVETWGSSCCDSAGLSLMGT